MLGISITVLGWMLLGTSVARVEADAVLVPVWVPNAVVDATITLEATD